MTMTKNAKIEAIPEGLRIPEGISEKQWAAFGKRFAQTEAIQWQLGDWYKYGSSQFGVKKAQEIARAVTGYSQPTVYAYCQLAEYFPLESRVAGVSVSIHRELMLQAEAGKITAEQVKHYLNFALENAATIPILRDQIARDNPPSQPGESEQPTDASVSANPEKQAKPEPAPMIGQEKEVQGLLFDVLGECEKATVRMVRDKRSLYYTVTMRLTQNNLDNLLKNIRQLKKATRRFPTEAEYNAMPTDAERESAAREGIPVEETPAPSTHRAEAATELAEYDAAHAKVEEAPANQSEAEAAL